HEIAQDAPRTGPDLDRDRHARRQADQAIIDLHLALRQGNAGAVIQLLATGLAAVAGRAPSPVAGTILRTVANDRILGDAQHLAVQQAVAGEIEGVDLDLRLLSGVHEADVAIGHLGLDLEPA